MVGESLHACMHAHSKKRLCHCDQKSHINEQLKCAEILMWVWYIALLYSLVHCSFWGPDIYVVSSVNEYLHGPYSTKHLCLGSLKMLQSNICH